MRATWRSTGQAPELEHVEDRTTAGQPSEDELARTRGRRGTFDPDRAKAVSDLIRRNSIVERHARQVARGA